MDARLTVPAGLHLLQSAASDEQVAVPQSQVRSRAETGGRTDEKLTTMSDGREIDLV